MTKITAAKRSIFGIFRHMPATMNQTVNEPTDIVFHKVATSPLPLKPYDPLRKRKRRSAKQTIKLPISLLAVGTALLIAISPASADLRLPPSGLVMHLDASLGVQTENQHVQYWWDQSGYGQGLQAVGTPRLINNVLAGKPVIELVTEFDKLQQQVSSALPVHGNDRTLIVLSAVQRAETKVGYGENGCSNVFGLKQLPDGSSALETGCGETTKYAKGYMESGGWGLHVLMVRSGIFYHFRNGQLVDGWTSRLNTQGGPFQIAAQNLSTLAKGHFRIATLVGYNRALDTQELWQAQRHIGSKWFGSSHYFPQTPDLETLELPTPSIEMKQTRDGNDSIHISYRVSFADECEATTGWTRSRATAGSVKILNPQIGQQYPLNCWHNRASSVKTLSTDTRSLELTWKHLSSQINGTIGYRLFLGTTSRQYGTVIDVPVTPTNSHTLELTPGRYFMAMSSIDTDGKESKLSEEISLNFE